jgi:hypothetical protein
LAGSLAIKVPAIRCGYRLFLQGLLANLQEREWGRTADPRLCPVLLACPLGTFLVMRRADDIEESELPAADEFDCLPLDHKADNFGRLDGRIVLRDYGS